jgi:uncharacterized caspase-like protein
MQTENNSKRLALVIGNSSYGESFSTLENSANDAKDMKVKLESLGFSVGKDVIIDRTYNEMLQDLTTFTNRVHDDVTDVVVYYSGHGCSVRKSLLNYFRQYNLPRLPCSRNL